MKISRKWLNSYIVSNKSDSELVDAFTQLGLECTSEKVNSIDPNIVVGEIVDCIKHPNADRLKVCKVDVCDNELLTIVCGAPNVEKNILVPVAKVGSNLGNFKIKRTKIRDIVSHGMICSEKELGISDENEGIMILDSNLKKGHDLSTALSLREDTIFDFEITPNRGDCFSHLGIARELNIIENGKYEVEYEKYNLDDETKKYKWNTKDLIQVDIKNNNICSRYACRIIKNIKVTDSPQWLKNKLASIGQKSINNVVDLSNFIMFDLGQPLHVFDYNKLKGKKIEVRLSKKNEKILCLNNELKTLSNDDIVIADSNGPVAIAGVIGGFDSQVDSGTTNILLESAIFNEINIRKTSKKYEYDKEASKRFERGIDADNVISVMTKFTKLLIEMVGGETSQDFIDIPESFYYENKIKFNHNECNSFLGIDLTKAEYKKLLNKLSIDIDFKNNFFVCAIPSYRNDLVREIDLYEEIARIYGYDKIPSKLNFKISSDSLIHDDSLLEDKIRNILSNNSFNEHYSNSLYSEKETSFSNNKPIKIINPLSKDMEFVRNSLVPGILKTLSYNEKRECDFLKYYEIGSINTLSSDKYNKATENRKLCLGYLGNRIVAWANNKAFNIYEVKGDISMIMHNLGLSNAQYKVESINSNNDFTLSVLVGKYIIGEIISVSKKVRNEYDILSKVIICNIDLNQLNQIFSQTKIVYKKIISYPSIKRDIAILVHSSINHSKILDTIFEVSSDLLKDINLFDIYQDKSLDENTKSMAYSLQFQSPNRTLTTKEIDKEMILIMKNLKTKLKAKQR